MADKRLLLIMYEILYKLLGYFTNDPMACWRLRLDSLIRSLQRCCPSELACESCWVPLTEQVIDCWSSFFVQVHIVVSGETPLRQFVGIIRPHANLFHLVHRRVNSMEHQFTVYCAGGTIFFTSREMQCWATAH